MHKDTKRAEVARLPQPRAMTRSELQAFRAAGLDPVFFEITEENKMNFLKLSAMSNDWILDNVYQGHDFSSEPHNQLVELAESTFRLTYGLEKETKNS